MVVKYAIVYKETTDLRDTQPWDINFEEASIIRLECDEDGKVLRCKLLGGERIT